MLQLQFFCGFVVSSIFVLCSHKIVLTLALFSPSPKIEKRLISQLEWIVGTGNARMGQERSEQDNSRDKLYVLAKNGTRTAS